MSKLRTLTLGFFFIFAIGMAFRAGVFPRTHRYSPISSSSHVGQNPSESPIAHFFKPEKFTNAGNPLTHYSELHRKTLHTNEERHQLSTFLSDPEAIEAAAKILIETPTPHYDLKDEQSRLVAVDFLIDAMNADPRLDSAPVIAAEKVILSANLHPEQDGQLRKSLMGDKIELFARIAVLFPEKSREIHHQSRGTLLEKIINQAMS